jgi:hypothetical protein
LGRIALKKEESSSEKNEDKKLSTGVLKEEGISLIILLATFTVILQLVFFKEPILNTIRVSLSIFWMFLFGGFMIFYYWFSEFSFVERIVLGIALSSAAVGIAGYYAGLIGIHTSVHGILIPLIETAIGLYLIAQKLKG